MGAIPTFNAAVSGGESRVAHSSDAFTLIKRNGYYYYYIQISPDLHGADATKSGATLVHSRVETRPYDRSVALLVALSNV